jgi:polyhydroxyalkanoate synthesis regulator phasin
METIKAPMPSELDSLISESMDLRRQIQDLQQKYDSKRSRILGIMTATNQKLYLNDICKAIRTDPVSIESVSKELFIKALQEVDIPREKKVFIWNHSVKEVKRPETIILQALKNKNQVPDSNY